VGLPPSKQAAYSFDGTDGFDGSLTCENKTWNAQYQQ
jgi:hypothetical protein